jgi:hypothetical protein
VACSGLATSPPSGVRVPHPLYKSGSNQQFGEAYLFPPFGRMVGFSVNSRFVFHLQKTKIDKWVNECVGLNSTVQVAVRLGQCNNLIPELNDSLITI